MDWLELPEHYRLFYVDNELLKIKETISLR